MPLERPLSALEKTIWLARYAGPYNCLAIAEVEGPLTVEVLREALDCLQRRHSLLRARICVERGRVLYRTQDVPPIPLRVQDTPEGAWEAEAEQELTVPIEWDTGPLLRCVLLRHTQNRFTLFLNCSHAIADGFACAYLLRDLLVAAAAEPESPEPGLPPLPIPLSMEERLPARARGVRGFIRMIRFLVRDFLQNLKRAGLPRRLALDAWPPFEQRRSGLIHYRFDRAFTERLVARAREENTTVHGALCAASLLAVSKQMTDGAPRPLACTSSVDVRSRLSPPVTEEQGIFVSVLWTVQNVWKEKPFWDLAREVRQDLKEKVRREGHLATLASTSWLVPLLERLLPKGKRGSLLYARLLERTMLNYRGTGVSNGGVVEFPEGLGPFRIKSYSGGVSLLNTGYFVALVATVNGEMFINYVFNEPLISRDKAEKLAKGATEILCEALAHRND